MRYLLSIFFILFITDACFALSHEPVQPAFQTGIKKKPSLFEHFFNKTHSENESSLTRDGLEQTTLIQHLLKKQGAAHIQLLRKTESGQVQDPLIKTYISTTQLNHLFIYHFLFPKHVFW